MCERGENLGKCVIASLGRSIWGRAGGKVQGTVCGQSVDRPELEGLVRASLFGACLPPLSLGQLSVLPP